jgi:hypothetical protein
LSPEDSYTAQGVNHGAGLGKGGFSFCDGRTPAYFQQRLFFLVAKFCPISADVKQSRDFFAMSSTDLF